MWFYPQFAVHLNLSQGLHNTFSLKEYGALYYSKIITAIVYEHFSLFMLVIIFIIGYSPTIKLSPFSSDQLFSILLLFIIILRFIIFPELADRFNIAYYLCALILLIKKYAAPKNVLLMNHELHR